MSERGLSKEKGEKLLKEFQKEFQKSDPKEKEMKKGFRNMTADAILKEHGREHVFMVSYMTAKGYGMTVGNVPPEELAVKLKKDEGGNIVILWSRRISLKRAIEIGLVDMDEIIKNLYKPTPLEELWG